MPVKLFLIYIKGFLKHALNLANIRMRGGFFLVMVKGVGCGCSAILFKTLHILVLVCVGWRKKLEKAIIILFGKLLRGK